MKITNEQIAKCMAGFDFEKASELFHQNNWIYYKNPPNKWDLIDIAYSHLTRVQEKFEGSMCSSESGRLKATAYTEEEGKVVLKLELIAESVSV